MAAIANKKVLLFSTAYKETTPLELVAAALSDFGAYILTVEYMTPFNFNDVAMSNASGSTKLSLNLKNKKIREFVLKELIPRVDIILESYRPGVMERFGLSPETVHNINPAVIFVRVSGYGNSIKMGDQIGTAGRDLNYLAASGILSKFRRSGNSYAPVAPANLLSYYASGSMYILTLLMQALMVNKKRIVLDCPLTKMLAYTSQPCLLDAHLTEPSRTPGFKPNNYTKPHEAVYCLVKNGGVHFVFRPGGPLHNKLRMAHFGNDDPVEANYIQETIQMAVCDMTAKQVEKEYGPIILLQELEQAVKSPDTFSQHLYEIVKKPDNEDSKRIIIKNVFKPVPTDDSPITIPEKSSSTSKVSVKDFQAQSGWDKLVTLGVETLSIEKIKKKMLKIN